MSAFFQDSRRSYTAREYVKAVEYENKYGGRTLPCEHGHDDCALEWDGPCLEDAKKQAESEPKPFNPYDRLKKKA